MCRGLAERLSLSNARWKWGELDWPWRISRSNFCKPCGRSVRLAPLFRFERKARPRSSHVEQNISHSRIWCLRCHPLTFSRAKSAFEWRDHDNRSPRNLKGQRTPPPATVQRRQAGD